MVIVRKPGGSSAVNVVGGGSTTNLPKQLLSTAQLGGAAKLRTVTTATQKVISAVKRRSVRW